MQEFFRRVSAKVSNFTGTAIAFVGAFGVVVLWAVTGPLFGFSNTWQLVINTGTTIVTFLMVFLIQNTQNRDGKAVQLKLDELIRVSKARDSFVDLEDLTDQELAEVEEQFKRIHDESDKVLTGVHKLHQRIEAEHGRRKNLASQATHVVGQVAGAINHLAHPVPPQDPPAHPHHDAHEE